MCRYIWQWFALHSILYAINEVNITSLMAYRILCLRICPHFEIFAAGVPCRQFSILDPWSSFCNYNPRVGWLPQFWIMTVVVKIGVVNVISMVAAVLWDLSLDEYVVRILVVFCEDALSTPVLPKPLAPRSVEEILSVVTTGGILYCSNISCAILSLGWTWNFVVPKLY